MKDFNVRAGEVLVPAVSEYSNLYTALAWFGHVVRTTSEDLW